MKKLTYILIVFSLLISWCSFSQKEPIDMHFDDAVSIFSHSMTEFYLKNNGFLNTKDTDYHVFFSTDWWNPNLTLYWSVDVSWQETYTKTENNFDREFLFDFYYQDKNKSNWNTFQWLLFQKKVWDNYFTKLSNWVVDLGTWNYETDFVKLLISNLWEKWIKYDPEFSKKVWELKEKQLEFFRDLQYGNLYEYIDKVTYEWNTAYKTNKWTLIIRDKDTVELKFDDVEIIYNWVTYFIKWNIAWEYGNVSIKDDKNSTKSIEISRQKKKQNLLLNISSVENFKNLRELNLTIKDFWIERGDISLNSPKYKLDWYLKISPILIYWSELENETKININCFYEKNALSWNISIYEPDNYILLDQILWDEYSLKSILWDENFN